MGKTILEALSKGFTEDSDPLLVDYEQAAEDARHRDRMLHTSYYLSLIYFVLLLGVLAQIVNQSIPSISLVIAVSGLGFVSTVTIAVWIANIRGARNASSDRREEIESEFNQLQSYRSWDNRCKTWVERRHPSSLFYLLLGLSALFWLSVFSFYFNQIL